MARMKSYKREPKPSGYKFEFKQSEPQERGGSLQTSISEIAMRDLPKSSYALKADPYNETNQASTAFPLIAHINKNLAPSYEGKANLEGGKASRYISALNTRLNKAIDSVLAKVKFNYRYLNLEPCWSSNNKGIQINAKMIDAIAEAVSQLNATTFTDNAVANNYIVRTYMKMPSQYQGSETETVTVDGTSRTIYGDFKDSNGHVYYTNPAVVIFVFALMYQINVQNCSLGVSVYNKARSFMGCILDHQYNKNINYVNIFDGQIKKAAFQNLLQTLSLSIQGEYFDVDWFKQTNTILTTPSAKSNSVWDPVIEITGANKNIPFTEVYLATDKQSITPSTIGLVCDNTTLQETYKDIDGTPNAGDSTKIITELIGTFTIFDILTQARNATNNVDQAVAVYNHLVSLYNALSGIMTRLKTSFTDLRTVFDVLGRTGIVNWSKDSYPTTFVSYDQIKPQQYRLIDDMLRATLSGGSSITYDVSTGNWVVQTPWDMYEGIPQFDSISGGCFITMSSKTVTSADSEVLEYIPVWFEFDADNNNNVLFCLFRDGQVKGVTRATTALTGTDLNRLAILPSQDSDSVYYPSATTTSDSIKDQYLIKTLIDLTGVAKVGSRDIQMSPTLIAMYDVQIVDVQNLMTAYGKTYGPIKGTAADSPKVGFKI